MNLAADSLQIAQSITSHAIIDCDARRPKAEPSASQRFGSLDRLDRGEQPVAAAAADEGPHLLGLDRAARVAADEPVGIARRAPDPDDVVERPPPQIGGGILQVALF